MAITQTLVTGVTGSSGPNAVGEWAEEIWQIVGDGSTANLTITPRWLRQVFAYDAGPGTTTPTAIGTLPASTLVITCPALPNGIPIYFFLRGIWR